MMVGMAAVLRVRVGKDRSTFDRGEMVRRRMWLPWSREGFRIMLFTANDVDIHNHIHTALVPSNKLTALREQSQLLIHSRQEWLDDSTRDLLTLQRARRAIWDFNVGRLESLRWC